MTLEGLYDLLRRNGDRRGITETLQGLLKIAVQRSRPGPRPDPDAGVGQDPPGETATRIDLALRRDVGVADDIARFDGRMARNDAFAEFDQRRDLARRVVVAITVQVDDLDTDLRGIQCFATTPPRAAGVPGGTVFCDETVDRAVFGKDIVRAHAMLSRVVAQDVE